MSQIMSLVTKLSLLSPRQGENEVESAKLIEYFLTNSGISLTVQMFSTRIPIGEKGESYSFQSRNFLVGNTISPKKIIFIHYDSLGGGAIDNAGSVATCLDLITTNSRLLNNNLFVFSGNEELSYDKPIYWGKGYREFEKKYAGLLMSAEEIIVVDGVGLTEPEIIGKDLIDFFPIKYIKELFPKITIVSSTQSGIMKCYHCAEDTSDKINIDFLKATQSLLQQKLQN